MLITSSACGRALLALLATTLLGVTSAAPSSPPGLTKREDVRHESHKIGDITEWLKEKAHSNPPSLVKRERVPDDATKAGKVVEWLKEKTPVAKDKAVFYSNSQVGRPMADAFCNANAGYKYYWQIFNQDFMNDVSILSEIFDSQHMLLLELQDTLGTKIIPRQILSQIILHKRIL